MEILSCMRKTLGFIGYLPGERISRFEFVQTIWSLFIASMVASFGVTSAFYMVHHLRAGEIENSLEVAYQMAGTISMAASFLTIIYHKKKVQRVIDTFQLISNKCKYFSIPQGDPLIEYYFVT